MTKQADILEAANYRPVLDHGFVGMVDHMGSDHAIVQAARVSYGAGTKTVNEDRGLIRYLLRHAHTTPFEMCEVKLHVRAPLFVIRQWQRHRTASINEESARYSEMTGEFYMPDRANIMPQSSDNKQGRAGELSEDNKGGVLWMMDASYGHTRQAYEVLLGDKIGADPSRPGFDVLYDPYSVENPLFTNDFPGIARELARSVMPVGAYSEFYWKCNLHNLFNFLRLRADAHAQYEIRVFADAIVELARPLFPAAFEAWDDYVRGGVKLSRMEQELLMDLLHAPSPCTPVIAFSDMVSVAGSMKALAANRNMSLRELREFAGRYNLVAA